MLREENEKRAVSITLLEFNWKTRLREVDAQEKLRDPGKVNRMQAATCRPCKNYPTASPVHMFALGEQSRQERTKTEIENDSERADDRKRHRHERERVRRRERLKTTNRHNKRRHHHSIPRMRGEHKMIHCIRGTF